METNTVSLKNLTPLSDFPGYYINICNGDVYSNFLIGHSKKPTLRRLSGKLNGRNKVNTFRTFGLRRSGKTFCASKSRLMISAKYGISYFDIPGDISCNYTPSSGIVVRSRREAAVASYKERLEKFWMTKSAVIDKEIKCLKLVRQAMEGDTEPLFDYVFNRKNYYLYLIRNKRHWSRKRADEAFMLAFERLHAAIKGDCQSDFIRLDKWIVKTAIALSGNREKKEIGFDEIAIQIRKSIL